MAPRGVLDTDRWRTRAVVAWRVWVRGPGGVHGSRARRGAASAHGARLRAWRPTRRPMTPAAPTTSSRRARKPTRARHHRRPYSRPTKANSTARSRRWKARSRRGRSKRITCRRSSKSPWRAVPCIEDPLRTARRTPSRAWKSSATATTSRTSTAKRARDVMYGSGWVAAKDRGLLLKLGLGPAFVAALSVPGPERVRTAAHRPLASRRATRPKNTSANQVQVPARKRAPRRTGDRRPRSLGGRRQRLRGNAPAERPAAPRRRSPQAIAGLRLHRLDLRQRRRQRSHQLEPPRAPDRDKFGETEALKIFHDLRESNDPEAPDDDQHARSPTTRNRPANRRRARP